MAEDDIYGSKGRYEALKRNLGKLVRPPSGTALKGTRGGPSKYYCRDPANLRYFRALMAHFEARDLSYIRRIRVLQTMKCIAHFADKDLQDCGRDDVDRILAEMHKTYKTVESKKTFIKQLKYIWKVLFPENDEKGRPDDTIVPYAVRHVSARVDRSRQKLRRDKLTLEEFERIVGYFGGDRRMQAYLTLAVESLARPQELLYVKVGDVELHDNYARIFISEHGKEGVGLLQCIDSYPYLLKWLEVHPQKSDPKAFLFVNTVAGSRCAQLRPANVNKMIRTACRSLGIDKPVTCYSLKRNGVTIRRLRGESDMEIQHAARWTSTKQLRTYDLSNQDEAFKLALQKRGLIAGGGVSDSVKTKKCQYCGEQVGFADSICGKCKHAVDRKTVLAGIEKDAEIARLRKTVHDITGQVASIKEQIMRELMSEVLEKKQAAASPALVAGTVRTERESLV